MSSMEFKNFGEFADFCETAKPHEWSEDEKTEFNQQVYSLLKKDENFSQNYQKMCVVATKKGIRHNLAKKRKTARIRENREEYRTAKKLRGISKLQELYR